MIPEELLTSAFSFLDVENKGRLTLENLKSRLALVTPKMKLSDVQVLFLADDDTSTEAEMTLEDLQTLVRENELTDFDPIAEAFHLFATSAPANTKSLDDTGGTPSEFLDPKVLRQVFENLGFGHLTSEDMDILVRCHYDNYNGVH